MIFPFTFGIMVSSDFARMPFDIWMSVLYAVFVTTGIAYCPINHSLKTVSPNLNGIYIDLQPFVAAVFAIILRKTG